MTSEFVRLVPLAGEHLPDLERDFDPSLFQFYPKPYATARQFVEENLEMVSLGTFEPFAILWQATGEAIGCTEFSAIDRIHRKREIGGSWLKRRFHGSPANAEAKLLMLTLAFEELKYVRVQFTAHVANAQSRVGIERLGAKFEGILRNAMILPNGELRDDAYYSVIHSDWPQIKVHLTERVKIKRQRWVSRGFAPGLFPHANQVDGHQ